MKKYFSLLVAFVAFLSSCTNDDIGSSYTKDEHFYETFTYNVNTQPVFDAFNATSTIKDKFLSGELGSFQIGVFTYIYNASGDIVESKVSYNQTFGSESSEFTLENGKYTAVSIEMLVDKDDNYMSPSFEIKGKEKLSTLEIAYRKDEKGNYHTESLWYQCVGVSTKEILVENSMSAVTVVPSPIGVVVECEFYNFDNSQYDFIVLQTKNCPIGRYVDPSKKGDERFRYDHYNSTTDNTDYVEIRKYRWKTPLTNSEGFDVYLLEEGTSIECRLGVGIGSEVQSGSRGWDAYGRWNSFVDGKTYYAGLYYIGGARKSDCDGGIFDNINDFSTWYNTAKTKYKPATLTALTEPFTTWGSSVSTVQSNMTGYTLAVGSAGKAVASSSGSYYIAYSAKSPLYAIYYYFNSETTGLNESDVFYLKSNASKEKLLELLDNKYTYLVDSEGTYIYMTKDGKTYVLLMEMDDYWLVGYMDPSVLSSSAQKQPMYESMKRAVKERNSKILSSPKKVDMVSSSFIISNTVKDRVLSRIK